MPRVTSSAPSDAVTRAPRALTWCATSGLAGAIARSASSSSVDGSGARRAQASAPQDDAGVLCGKSARQRRQMAAWMPRDVGA